MGEEVMVNEEFERECAPQLLSSGVPRHMWSEAFRKLSEEVYDAGRYLCWFKYAVKGEQNESPTYLTYLTPADEEGLKAANPENVFVVDHAWLFEAKDAEQHLAAHPSLLTRMCKLMNINYEDQDDRENIRKIIKEMWRFCYTFKIRTAEMAPHEAKIMWYINDEVGSMIAHSDSPNCRMAPVYFKGTTYTLLWPIKDIDYEEVCTVDRAMAIDHPKIRQARLQPWVPSDMTDISFIQLEPDPSYFEAYHQLETLPDPDIECPGLPHDRKIRVYIQYQNFDKFLTDPRFELVDTKDEADIIWIQTTFKDFRDLRLRSPGCLINQFPCENILTIKDLLAIVARRAASSPHKAPLNPGPRWLPVTFNLETELAEFVSYYQTREKSGLDNVWICKPWNLARGIDMTITDNLNHIVRLPETGPKVACKYVEKPVLFARDDVGLVKFDIRYIVLLRSAHPLSLYVYKVFWLRFANQPFVLDDFHDYEKHFTVMNYRPGSVLKQVNYDEFIPMFEKQYPDFPWKTVETSIFEMIRELFEAAVSKPPPMGIGHNLQSRALYAIDLLLKWDNTNEGDKCIMPQLCEVNFSPDCERACKYHPFFVNDVFRVLFLDDTEDKSVVKIA